MRVLVLGSGGREHALAWALARSASVSEVIGAPGNPGIASLGEVRDCDVSSPAEVVALARRVEPGLVVVGPEAPLLAGVADELRAAGVPTFGPGASAALIEGSKRHAKQLMDEAGIPTARWESFTEVAPALDYMDRLGAPYVIKADGLAAGKGVVVTEDRAEGEAALRERLEEGAFGEAGRRVVVEEYLDGQECSLIAFSDGSHVIACEPAQDYKRVGDGDSGPNTGGMGSYSPVPACPPELTEELVATVLQPMVDATARRGAPFSGALYAGLALTSRGPRVVEFNARFGDPETQALMPRLDCDLGEVCLAAARGELAGATVRWREQACVSVVLASGGYPGTHRTGYEISGLEQAAAREGVVVFHAGTARRGEAVVTAGGRVLAVSAVGDGFAQARRRAYDAAGSIHFEGKHARGDIAARAERHEGAMT